MWMIIWIGEGDTWNIFWQVDARLTRDTITTICALAEHARAASSGDCDHPKVGSCWTYGIDMLLDCEQLSYTYSSQRAHQFEAWFRGEHNETPMHPGCARRSTVEIFIIKRRVIVAAHGVYVRYYWSMCWQKVLVIWYLFGRQGDMTAKQGICCCKHSRCNEHNNIIILGFVDHMPAPICAGEINDKSTLL